MPICFKLLSNKGFANWDFQLAIQSWALYTVFKVCAQDRTF